MEALAQSLYEEQDPVGISWAKRRGVVREPWLLRARKQLKAAAAALPGAPQQ